jgi:hypothetical protein
MMNSDKAVSEIPVVCGFKGCTQLVVPGTGLCKAHHAELLRDRLHDNPNAFTQRIWPWPKE